MEDTGTSGTWDARFTSWLREKQAGPLRCPICSQGDFSPVGTVEATFADDAARPTTQFAYTSCLNCGYSIFFDADITGLRFSE